jgi:CO dehydrogenase/acetyl-CoA synthase epsilon subunit
MPAAKQALVFVRISINPNIDQPKGYSFPNVRKKAYVILGFLHAHLPIL